MTCVLNKFDSFMRMSLLIPLLDQSVMMTRFELLAAMLYLSYA